MKCKFTKANGKRCGTYAMENGYCFSHNPDKAISQKRTISRIEGGKKNKVITLRPGLISEKEIILNSPKDVKIFLTQMINSVMKNELDLRIATGINYICQSIVKIIEIEDFEKRLSILEKTIPQNNF